MNNGFTSASLVLALFVVISLALISPAYGQPQRGDRLEHRIEHMKQSLNLSEEQAAQAMVVFESAHEACASADSREEHRNCMQEQRDGVESQLSEILTEEQFATHQQKMQERKERRNKRRQARGNSRRDYGGES